MISVIKIGGNIIENEKELDAFLEKLAALQQPFVLVHGGGKDATAMAKQLGIETKMVNGRRVTDAAMLKIITMTYAGWLNKTIVAKLQALNCNAVGLSGADGNLIRSVKRNPVPVDFGFVGDPEEVNAGFMEMLLARNFIPVIAPVTHDKEGNLLNTNADTVAAHLAIALAKTSDVQLIFCFEKDGVLENVADENSVIAHLSEDALSKLQQLGKIHSGMLPKLNAGFFAKQDGVQRVVIGNAEKIVQLVASDSPCTQLEISKNYEP